MERASRRTATTLHNRLARSALSGVLLIGCATTGLTRQDVVRQYDAVAQLSDGLEDARGEDAALLAPRAYETTRATLDESFEHARDGDKRRANEAAQRGLRSLDGLKAAVDHNRQEMDEVLRIRARAEGQGAAVLFEEEANDVDERLRQAARLLEQGNTEAAREMRPALIDGYAKLELAALKKGTVETARQAIDAAAAAGAEEHSPKTLQNAREELQLALSVLDADRTAVDRGNAHAHRATWLAQRAHVITTLIDDFSARDLSGEERILWYQAQLQQVRRALNDEMLPFDQPNAKVIHALRADALALRGFMRDSRHTNELARQRVAQLEHEIDSQQRAHVAELQRLLRSHEEQLGNLVSGSAARVDRARRDAAHEVSELQRRLSTQALAQSAAERREAREQQRFEHIQQLFTPGQADVFRKGNNVLIHLQGFNFKPGKHQVESTNYALLNKVVTAINTFPEGSVKVTGHTDALGSDARNLELSAARAQSVVAFLSTVGGVEAARLGAAGAGESQPLATNETAEGRGKNRRIDLLIVNDQ